MMRQIAILLAQDYSPEEIAEELDYDLPSLRRLASSDMMILAVGKLRNQGAIGVDKLMEESLNMEFTDDPAGEDLEDYED